MSPKTGSRRSAARHRHRERWYDYRDADGNVVGRKSRFVLTETRADVSSWAAIHVGKSFSRDSELPLRGAQAPLYQLPDVIAAITTRQPVRVPTLPRRFMSAPMPRRMA